MYAMNSVTYLSGPEHILWPQIWMGVGVGFLIAPVMTASLVGLTGTDLGDGSGLFNMTRQLGGTIGIALISTILTKRIHFHNTMITEHINIYNPETLTRFTMYQQAFMSKGSDIATAQSKSLYVMQQTIQGQAVIMSYNDLFLILAAVYAVILPFIFFLKDPKPGEAKVQVSMH
jgi:DHA2 family multidrug resistance protein